MIDEIATAICREISEIALDVLWFTQLSLVPLFLTIPEVRAFSDHSSAKDGKGQVTLSEFDDASALTWERTLKYASRIRRLWHDPNVPVTFSNAPDVEVIASALGRCPRDYLMPNLVHFHSGAVYNMRSSPLFYPHISLLASPSIRKFSVKVFKPPHAVKTITTFLKTCKEVESGDIAINFIDDDGLLLDRQILDPLTSLRKLTVLRLVCPDSLSDEDWNASEPVPKGGLAELRRITMDIDSLAPAMALLSSISSSELTSLTINSKQGTGDSLRRLLSRFKDVSFNVRNVQTLKLNLSLRMGVGRGHANEGATIGDCLGLLAFRGLRVVHLQLPLELTDNAFADFAGAWPQIEEFSFSSNNSSFSKLTLRGLTVIPSSWPRLRYLTLGKVDCQTDVPSVEVARTAAGERKEAGEALKLFLSIQSPIDPKNVNDVADFLMALFPGISFQQFGAGFAGSGGQASRTWQKVHDVINGTGSGEGRHRF